MPHHLMNLRHVPDDERDEIRALFEEHEIRYYETPPSFWGISMGGLWTHEASEAERARGLLQEYQTHRLQSGRQAWNDAVQQGMGTGIWHQFLRKPVTVIAALLALVFILGVSLAPFLRLGASATESSDRYPSAVAELQFRFKVGEHPVDQQLSIR